MAYAAIVAAWPIRHVAITIIFSKFDFLTRSSPRFASPDAPLVTAIIPAKDEEDKLGECLDSVRSQDYPNLEILVVDDRSTDRTPEIARDAARADPRVRLLSIERLPNGWTGKTHALHVAAKQVDGAWFWFLDADTLHAPESLSVMMEYARRNDAALASLVPEMRCETFWEKVVQPLAGIVLMRSFPLFRVNNDRDTMAFANGQYILIRKDAYLASGGHEAVRDRFVEDIYLAKAVKAKGFPIRTAMSTEISSTRMYTNLPQIVRGWSRILYDALGRRSLPLIGKVVEPLVFSQTGDLAVIAALILLAVGTSAMFAWWLLGLGLAHQVLENVRPLPHVQGVVPEDRLVRDLVFPGGRRDGLGLRQVDRHVPDGQGHLARDVLRPIDGGGIMATAAAHVLITRNPANGAELARIDETPPGAVSSLVALANARQEEWAEAPIRDRIAVVRRFWAILARDAEALARAIRDEVGKPLPEAQIEIAAALDALRWTVKNAARLLRDSRLSPGHQRVLMMRSARLRWVPWGVVGVIGTWNYPILLDAPALAQAIAAGNGVAWKPSEFSAHVASLLRDRLAEAGTPDGLIATLFGGPTIGQALVDAPIDKGFFTGGVVSGRRVLACLASRGVPAVAELSGFDSAILLPDATASRSIDALMWASFVGAGQTCVAVKRIYVVGDAAPWASALAEKTRALRVGDPSSPDVDIGPMISEAARDRFHDTIQSAIDRGAALLCGGEPIDGPGWFYPPTVLSARSDAPESALAGVFGPVVIVRGVATVEDAIRAANGSGFGLAASVWGEDMRRCRSVADRLEAGMVTINDAVTPSGMASAPFGGSRSSGFGRVRGELGLREFVRPRAIHERRPGGYRPHLFPYGGRLAKILAVYRSIFHGRSR